MAAALRKRLVLELNHRGAGALEETYCSLHVQSVAVARIAVNDDGQAHPIGDTTENVSGFARGSQADIGSTQLRVRHRAARQIDRLEAGLLSSEGRQGVIDAGDEQGGGLPQAGAKFRC